MGILLILIIKNLSIMKQLLTVLHAEDRLSPSALSIVKGGDAIIMSCGLVDDKN